MARSTLASPAIFPVAFEAHRSDAVEGFTKKYSVHMLVYFELHADMYEAIQRESD
jgi:predicted GIY-YIG superfamily endonuclease